MVYFLFIACLSTTDCKVVEMAAPNENVTLQQCEKQAQYSMVKWLATHPNYTVVEYWCEKEV